MSKFKSFSIAGINFNEESWNKCIREFEAIDPDGYWESFEDFVYDQRIQGIEADDSHRAYYAWLDDQYIAYLEHLAA